MTDNEEIIKEATEAVEKGLPCAFLVPPLLEVVKSQKAEIDILIRKKEALRDEVAEQKAEIERLQKLQKPTKTSGFIIQNGKVVFYSNMLNGYRHEYKDLDEVVKELNLMLQSCYKCDEVVSHYKGNLKTAKSEAYREFAERLKEISKEVTVAYVADTSIQEHKTGMFYYQKEDFDNLVKELTRNLHATYTESK